MTKEWLKPYRFSKGTSGNPGGRPKNPLNKENVSLLMGNMAHLTREQLKEIVQDQKSTMIEVMVAKIMVKAVENGDPYRLDFMLNRSIGKVTEEVEIATKALTREDISNVDRKKLRELLSESNKDDRKPTISDD